MSKLPRHLIPSFPENALDYAITQCHETILPLVHMTGHIPNIITTYSLLCGMVCVWSLQHSHFLLFMMTFVLQYVCDCMNEYLARTYAMTSHDQVFHAVLLVVVVKRHYQMVALVRTSSHISAPVPAGAVFLRAKKKSNCPATATLDG